MNIDHIRKLTGGKVFINEPLSQHTTFRTGGNADCYVVPETPGELAELIKYFSSEDIDYFVIGNGSNVLASDSGFRGVIIDLGKNPGTSFSEMRISRQSGGEIRIRAGAGCLMNDVGLLAAKASATGFESLTGIPGCVGGAVMMNAGAFDREMKDVLTAAHAVSKDGKIVRISAGEAGLRYRGSSLADKSYIVTGAEILLRPGDPDMINSKIEELKNRRKEKQPLEYPSAGSTFKRPAGYFAGKLISDAGLKGCSIGGAAVSEKHAGFIINKAGATSSDIYKLIKYVRGRVFEEFNVELEPEVKFLGLFED